MTRILIAGGYGVVGAWIARRLHEAHPGVELLLGGRRPEAGEALAAEVGGRAVVLEVGDAGPAVAALGPLDLVIGALRDPDNALLTAALAAGAGYTSIVTPTDNIGVMAALAAAHARRGVLMQGGWLGGAMTFAALDAARAFRRVDRIELAALYDYADPIGPMTATDSGGFFGAAVVRQAGRWARLESAAGTRSVDRGEAAPPFMAQPMTMLDVPGLVAKLGAADVRYDLGTGSSLGALAGRAASHESYVDLWGEGMDGAPLARRVLISDPRGQAHLTALCVLIGAEQILGLSGRTPTRPGIAFVESAIDPAWALGRLRAFGVTVDAVGGVIPPD